MSLNYLVKQLIPSHEIYNLDLIKKSCENFKKVFISVGACEWEEFNNILKSGINLKKVFYALCFILSFERGKRKFSQTL